MNLDGGVAKRTSIINLNVVEVPSASPPKRRVIHPKRRQGNFPVGAWVFALLCLLLHFLSSSWMNIQPSRRARQTDKNCTENKEKLG